MKPVDEIEIISLRARTAIEQEVLERQLRTDIIATMQAAREHPESFSDWDFCAKSLLRMYDVKRKPLIPRDEIK